MDHKQKNGKIRRKSQKTGGAMAQERYAKDILPIVRRRKEEVERAGGQFVFQEDNDGSHGTRSDKNIARFRKVQMELEFIENWPHKSPESNPIENVWRILKSRVKLHKYLTSRQLRQAMEEEWKKITLKEINECFWIAPMANPTLGESKKGSQICRIGCNSAGSGMDTLLHFRRSNSRKLVIFSVN